MRVGFENIAVHSGDLVPGGLKAVPSIDSYRRHCADITCQLDSARDDFEVACARCSRAVGWAAAVEREEHTEKAATFSHSISTVHFELTSVLIASRMFDRLSGCDSDRMDCLETSEHWKTHQIDLEQVSL